MILDRAHQDLNYVSEGKALGVTPRTDYYLKFAINFIIFKWNLVYVPHFIEYILPRGPFRGSSTSLKPIVC